MHCSPVARGMLATRDAAWWAVAGSFWPRNVRPSEQRAWAGPSTQPPGPAPTRAHPHSSLPRSPRSSDPVRGAPRGPPRPPPPRGGASNTGSGWSRGAQTHQRVRSRLPPYIDFCYSREAHPIKNHHPPLPSLPSCQVYLRLAENSAMGSTWPHFLRWSEFGRTS